MRITLYPQDSNLVLLDLITVDDVNFFQFHAQLTVQFLPYFGLYIFFYFLVLQFMRSS